MGMFFSVFGQGAMNNDTPFAKQAGDFTLGVDATPLFGLINHGRNEGFSNTVFFKYFLNENGALRAKLFLNFTQEAFKQTVADQHAIAINPTNVAATTVDTRILDNQGVGLNFGYEFRKGSGRVQGFYGVEALFGYSAEKNSYEYGNPITSANRNPTTANFDGNATPTQGTRIIERKTGATLSAGLGGFLGIEIFLASQVSVGGELGLNFNYMIGGQNEITSEGWLDSSLKEYSYRERNGGRAFNIGGSTMPTGSIFLMLHF